MQVISPRGLSRIPPSNERCIEPKQLGEKQYSMGSLEDFFPYQRYRPHQREMLEAASRCAREGGILMIDAPTGSGKSSTVAALLSEARGRKVLIAVRTVSQLDTFTRELALIRKQRPDLKFAYLVGKSMMCPLGGEGDVYRRCEVLKSLTSALMRDRANAGSHIPLKDPVIRHQIRRLNRDHPFLCPYFIASRIFLDQEIGGLRMAPSGALLSRAGRIAKEVVSPRDLISFCGDLCPYETMLQAARNSDAIILNFYHLFDDEVREQVYASLGLTPGETLLLIDEAHNCGDAVQSVQSVELEGKTLDLAADELGHLKKRSKSAEAVMNALPEIRKFMELVKTSNEVEDWFDPGIFSKMVIRGSFYQNLEEIVDDLLTISDTIREANMKAGDFKICGIERLARFLYKLQYAMSDPSFLPIYRREGDSVTLEVRNIDPAERLSEVARSHACCVMISGTLSPVHSFRRYYFGDEPVTTLTLPNSFPPEHRRILCTCDITTAFSKRRDAENIRRIHQYIREFMKVGGNIAIYLPSYQLLETLAQDDLLAMSGREYFLEPRQADAARAKLNEFLSLPSRGGSGVLIGVCGGKWSEGLDYRGELLNGAMVIGLPLAPYNRVRMMIIEYFKRKFGEEGEFISYTLPAINRVLQALGRVIRTPEEHGILILGERRFLEPRIKGALPVWFQEEMLTCDVTTFDSFLRGWR